MRFITRSFDFIKKSCCRHCIARLSDTTLTQRLLIMIEVRYEHSSTRGQIQTIVVFNASIFESNGTYELGCT